MHETNVVPEGTGIRIAQLVSMVVMWVFVISISLWILNLLLLAIDLQDALGATFAIGMVAIPVFLTLACVLTYVFIELDRENRRLIRGRPEE